LLEGFRNVKILTGLKGRWEILSLDPLTICDTAHNEDGIKEVLNQIKAINYNQLHIVFGIVKDKDPEKILQLLPLDARYYFTQAAIPRAMNAEDLKKSAENFNLEGEVVYNINDAIKSARINASKDDLIFIGGSIFVVAEIEGL
jgi:dihydrofolate synthase/folylpolyglutamate synthase